MKTALSLFNVIAILFFGIFLFSCQPATDHVKIEKSVIIGECLDCTETKQAVLNTKWGLKEFEVGPEGFEILLTCDRPMVAEVIMGMYSNLPLYIAPGDSLSFAYNKKDLTNGHNNLIYRGPNAAENKILFDLWQLYLFESQDYNYPESVFLDKLDSLKNMGESIINSYRSGNPMGNNDFIDQAQIYIQYRIAYHLEKYHNTLKYSFAKEPEEKSKEFLSYQESFFIQDSLLLDNIAYINYIGAKVRNKTLSIFLSEEYDKQGRKMPGVRARFTAINSMFSDKKTVDYLKYMSLHYEMLTWGNNAEVYFEEYKKTDPPQVYLDLLNNEVSKITEAFNEGMKMPNYSFFDADGNLHMMDEFKGKVVYMDLWATWCYWCHDERKHFEVVMDYFKDETDEIVFIGLSLDKEKDREKWKKMLHSKDIKGVQLIAQNAFDSKICKDFRVTGIPRFIILGKNGEIIQADALRPSDENIYTVLADLMKN